MPKLLNPTINDTCFYCNMQANWISINSKALRCTERVTCCPGFITKAENSRKRNINPHERAKHMKKMSVNGNKKLKELHSDPLWVATKSKNISSAVHARGGHRGENNPMHNRKHKISSKQLQSQRAKNRAPQSYKAATNTKIKRGLATPKELKSDWKLYQDQVTNHTNKNWNTFQHIINPTNLKRGRVYELDHKFSRTEGFRMGVPPEIIGHHANLELLPKIANRKKRTQCSITLTELYEAAKTK